MTSLPFDPRHRYTVEEFAALPEDNSVRYELQEGSVVMSPRPAPVHMNVIRRLGTEFERQLPGRLVALPEIDVDLRLVPPVVRVPDVVVASASVFDRSGMVTAADVHLAVEIISPGSLRTDTLIKPMEYAAAGIEHLWLIDPDPPVTATVYRLVDGNYEESQRAEQVLEVELPCPLRIDLDSLLPR